MVVAVAAAAGGAFWYMRKRRQQTELQAQRQSHRLIDYDNVFLAEGGALNMQLDDEDGL